MLVKILIFCFVGVILPIILGMTYSKFTKEESFCIDIVSGYIILWGCFEVVVMPCIAFKCSLSTFIKIYGSVICFLMVISVVLNWKKMRTSIWTKIKKIFKSPWTVWIAIIFVLAQTFIVAYYQHIDDDDAFYVGTAEAAVSTNTIMEINPYTGEKYDILPARYVLSPFPIYVAVMAIILDMRPVTLAHTVLPILLVPLAYVVYYLLGLLLFEKDKKNVGIFLVMISIINVFSGYSSYTQGTFMLFRIWQGKAVLVSILLPAIVWFAFKYMNSVERKAEIIIIMILMTACCFVSSMGIMLAAIMVGVFSLIELIEKRNIRRALPLLACCSPNLVCIIAYFVIR